MTSVRIISRLTSNFFVAHFTFTFDLSLKRKLQRGERSPEWTRATNLLVLCYRDFQAAGWALHPRDTRKHAVLCNLRGFLQIPQRRKFLLRALFLLTTPRPSLMLHLCKSVSLLWDKSATVKAIPLTPVPLSTVVSPPMTAVLVCRIRRGGHLRGD